jgi:hypothetical protein
MKDNPTARTDVAPPEFVARSAKVEKAIEHAWSAFDGHKWSERAVPFTRAQQEKFKASLVSLTLETIEQAETIRALTKRVSDLEYKQVRYLGVWAEGKVYGEHSMCTDHGSMWYAQRATCQRPGTNDDWVLAVKKGRDGKASR